MPIRPKNINAISIHLDPVESRGVRLSDSPTVPNAEKHSKTIRLNANWPSINEIANEPRLMINKDMITMAKALLTEYS